MARKCPKQRGWQQIYPYLKNLRPTLYIDFVRFWGVLAFECESLLR